MNMFQNNVFMAAHNLERLRQVKCQMSKKGDWPLAICWKCSISPLLVPLSLTKKLNVLDKNLSVSDPIIGSPDGPCNKHSRMNSSSSPEESSKLSFPIGREAF